MAEFIGLSGDYGSGGGQILRTALGLSALLQKPISVNKIRYNRPTPGLQAQHLTALTTLKQICDAQVEGAKQLSQEIKFSPRAPHSAQLHINIGTAGSITLLLQSIILPALLHETKLRIVGGTDVAWAPSANYMQNVLLPALSKAGAKFDLELNARGYYPKGLGSASFSSKPARLPLKPVSLVNLGNLERIRIISHCANLPKEVALNQLKSAKKTTTDALGDIDFDESIECREKSETTGSGIDLFAYFDSGAIIGANALGEKGKPAEKVGREAAEKLLKELSAKKPCDSHLADQLIPFMALAQGYSTIETTSLTEHAQTNIFVVEKFLPVKFEVSGSLGEPAEISVLGAGFK
ncbi:MAG: RNA 3'-terminal phosphate cyclase [Candidatus Diapherotrites archaeon]|nr:RNA 3'-terminal phosphate cyclase [Candidatus Diapherotrites archaeon]